MVDFNNPNFLKLRRVDDKDFANLLAPMLVSGEEILSSYRNIRDGVVFTNKRLISINIQGVTGKKKDLTHMPYSKIQVYSIETSGTFDLDSELTLWFSSVGRVTFEFLGSSNVVEICQNISANLL